MARLPTQPRPDTGLPDAQRDAPLAAVFAQLEATDQGLSREEARRRLAVVGPNDLVGRSRFVILRELLRFVANPLVAILLAASLVSAVVGEVVSAAIIAVMVLLSVVLNFVQSFRSQRAAAQLRAMVTLTASVRRDGAWLEVPQHDLVPGDVIRLAAGDLVPADARLIEARDLHLQEAALTGESLPAEKEAEAGTATPLGDAAHASAVFLGTSSAVVISRRPRFRASGLAQRLPVGAGQATRAFLWLDRDLRLRREFLHLLHHHRAWVRQMHAERADAGQPVAPPFLPPTDDDAVAFELPRQPARRPLELLGRELTQHLGGDLGTEEEIPRLQGIGAAGFAVHAQELQVLRRARLAIVEPRHPGPALVHRPRAGLTAPVFRRPHRQHDLRGDLFPLTVHRAAPRRPVCC